MAPYLTLPIIHVLYENPDWLPPLVEGLEAEGFTVELHELDGGLIDPSSPPPEGIWINRISPSSHTRGHHGSVGLTRDFLLWLESWGRQVINGSRAYEVEMSKLRQDMILRKHGIRTPRTMLVIGEEAMLEAAATFDGPFITKHNRGGKGLGIQLFHSVEHLQSAIARDTLEEAPDGQFILQEYVQSPGDFITRVEIVGGRFLFAMRSSTLGGFQLCPSDACQIEALEQAGPDVCPTDGSSDKFTLSPITARDPIVSAYIAMMASEGIDLAGIEFIEDEDGNRYTYDINGTTNYSGVLGEKIGIDGMREVAKWIKAKVARTFQTVPARRAS
jgi:glutathione synthase/RimK-type ligase-like ATP-grasp enzyme